MAKIYLEGLPQEKTSTSKAKVYLDGRAATVPKFNISEQRKTQPSLPQPEVTAQPKLLERAAQLPSAISDPINALAKTTDGIINLFAKGAQERAAAREDAYNPDLTPQQQMQAYNKLGNRGLLTPLAEKIPEKLFANYDPTQQSDFVKAQEERKIEATQKLKEGMNPAQSFLTDAALSGADMASRAATAAATGIPFLALTGLNTGAEAAQKALSEGYSADKALAYGTGSGAITAGIESFGGIAGSWGGKLLNTSIGKSAMGKLPQKAVDYVAKVGATKLGKILGDAGSEGLEEFGEYYAQNLFENILLDKDTPTNIKEALYNAGVGSVVGGVFGGGRVALDSAPDTINNIKQELQKPPRRATVETRVNGEPVPAPDATQEAAKADVQERGGLNPTTKTQKVQNSARRIFTRTVADKMSIPRTMKADFLNDSADALASEVFKTGKVSEETKAKVFEDAYNRGVVTLSEYYDQYKDLKRIIRDTKLTIAPQDASNIADYNAFKRSNFGTLTVGENGVPVDTMYAGLNSKHPDLFPVEITHPADQLQRISEVAKGIKKTETDLDDYYGPEAAKFKEFARYEFDKAVNGFADEMQAIRRYEAEQAAAQAKAKEVPTTLEEADAKYRDVQTLRKQAGKAVSKNLLTETDKQIVEQLLAGTISDVPPNQNLNIRGIREVYGAKKALRDAERPMKDYRKQVRQAVRANMDALVENATTWKDKSMGILYQRETMERNIYDIVPDTQEAEKIIGEVFAPVHANEAKSTNKRNEILERVKKLNIGTNEKYTIELPGMDPIKTSESGLVQMYGEGVINKTQLLAVGADVNKVEKAVNEFRAIYNELFALSSEAMVRNGFEPVEYRKDYFPHFEEGKPDTLLGKMAASVGINIQDDSLPTAIAGLTDTFKPGKKWVGNFLQRIGSKTDYNALKGMDLYLNGALDVIFHTDDVQRLRAFEDAIRYKFSDDSVKAKVDNIKENPTIDDTQRQKLLDEAFGTDRAALSNLVTNMRRYTDGLAGKKSFADRNAEQTFGRAIYTLMGSIENKIAANMVGGNISSALTNFIPIMQATGEVKPQYLAQAIKDSGKAVLNDDGFHSQSDFLTNRRGTEKLYKTSMDKAMEVLNTPFQAIDQFSSETVTRAKYLQNIAEGMDAETAIQDADKYAASLIADRSKGALPTMFNTKNFIMKTFTMFQVEVNNQFSHYFKDIPRDLADEGKKQIAMALFRVFIATGLYGELFKNVAGYDPTFNPIGLAKDYIKDLMDDETSLLDATTNLGKGVLREMPFVGNWAGGGRLPIEAAIPQGWTLNEWMKPVTMVAFPMGGNQLKKTVQGVSAFVKGGEFGTNADGEKQLKFAVERTPANAIKGALFGKWSFPEAQEYIDKGFKSLSPNLTSKMFEAEEAGIKRQDYLIAYNLQKDAKGDGSNLSAAKAKKNAINSAFPKMPKEQKEILYDAFGISKKVW